MRTALLSFLHLKPQSPSWKQTFIYIAAAYTFGLLLRLILFYQSTFISGLWDKGLPIPIWTPDAGRYGFYAKSILSGVEYPLNTDYLLGYLIAGVASLFHIPIDWVMLLLPIVIAPLIAIPIIMIGNSIKQPTLGFLAALLAVSDTLFYFRSYLGYMDTDGINLFLILLSIALIIKSFFKYRLLYALFSALTLILFALWYHSSSIIILSIVATTLAYVVLFERKDKLALQLIFILGITILPITLIYKLVLLIAIVLLFYILNITSNISDRLYFVILALLVVVGVVSIDPYHYIHRAESYISIDSYIHFTANNITYSYPNDLKNVGEVQGTNLWNIYRLPFLSVAYVFTATLGYTILVIAYPIILLTLPLITLGYTSTWAGLRFAMFASPVLAMGIIYLLFLLRKILSLKLSNSLYLRRSPYYMGALIVLFMIYNIFQFNTSAILSQLFYNTEKSALEKFGKNLTKEDAIVSWWDYGWPLWYYSGHDNTLTDNGYHGGPDLNIVAKLLLSHDQNFTYNAISILGNNRLKAHENNYRFVLPYLLKDQNYTTLLSSFNKGIIDTTQHKGNNYILLHRGMLNFFTAIIEQAQQNLKGDKGDTKLYAWTPLVKPFSHNYSLLEGYSFILDSSTGKVKDADDKFSEINTLMITSNNKRKESFQFHNRSKHYLIADRGTLIWLDESYYKSFYVQAMLFDAYDKNLFEKVVETGRIKIFRVKK